jgi:threonine dehydratase
MASKTWKVTLSDVQAARQVLRQYLAPTPLLLNPWLSDRFGCQLYLKLENMTPIGSFKIRGATHKIFKLTPQQKKKGVIAASAGNHAQGVAWGSLALGVKALIVMPKNAPLMKIQNTRALGAEIVLHGDGYDDAYAEAVRIARKTGRVFVHAYDDPHVIAGQGTAGLEILEQLPDADIIIGSVGGGGWMAGVGVAVKALRPETQLWACQASGAPSMVQSIKKGKAVRLESASTFADGISVREARESMRKLLDPVIDDWLTADDEQIAAGMLMLLEKGKVVAEGAGALSLIALEQRRKEIKGKKVVVMISGGNVDVNVLGRVIDRGLINAGRRIRVNVLMSDRPGTLAKLTALIAAQGANIIQAIHDRSEPTVRIDQTEVALTLETRGHEHSKEVIEALRSEVLDLQVVS